MVRVVLGIEGVVHTEFREVGWDWDRSMGLEGQCRSGA